MEAMASHGESMTDVCNTSYNILVKNCSLCLGHSVECAVFTVCVVHN